MDGKIECACCGKETNHTRVRSARICDGTHKWVGSLCCWPEITSHARRGYRGFYPPDNVITEQRANTVAELAKLTEPKKITRANVDDLLDRRMIQVRMKSGAWWDIRRNGKTQTWKSQPGRIRIPYKYGLKGYGAITTWDFVDHAGSKLTEGTRDYCDLTLGSLSIEFYRVKPGA